MTPDITGSLLRNAVALRRVENGIARAMAAIIERAYRKVIAILATQDPTAVSSGRAAARLASVDAKVSYVTDQLYRDIYKASGDQLVTVGEIQEQFAQVQLVRLADKADISVVGPALGRGFFRTVVLTDAIQGAPLKDWWAKQNASTQFDFNRQIRLGLTQNESINELVMRIRGRSVGQGKFVGGIMETSTRNATAVIRTAVNHVTNVAHFETYKANADISEEYQYVATLDSRTTPICRALDGQIFRYSDPAAPRPPQHVGCRSVIVPVLDWKGMGLEPPPSGSRASAGGPVSADTDYSDWLHDQTITEQDEILGPSRAALFRSGKVSLRDLVNQEGRTLTLNELKKAIL
jgi:SPP1 gp7 family putative phage head morphogenesis protein